MNHKRDEICKKINISTIAQAQCKAFSNNRTGHSIGFLKKISHLIMIHCRL